MFPPVPTIDIEPFFAGTDNDKDAVARQVGRTCADIGFLNLTGHGVAPSLINRFRGISQEFFGLPEAARREVQRVGPGQPGYIPFAEQAVSRTLGEESQPDLKETFSIAPEPGRREAYHRAAAAGAWFAPNRWPSRPSGFRTVWTEYYHAMERLGATLLRIFARALDLGDGYFDGSFDKHASRLAAVHYPPQERAPDADQLRNGPHTDYGALTILNKPAGAGGLQVLDKGGQWVDVAPPANSFVINLGDLMARWVNDRWVSTMHRVTNPPPEKASVGSISIVYFCYPNYDARISAPPSCVDDAHPARYQAITAGEYLAVKHEQQDAMAATGGNR